MTPILRCPPAVRVNLKNPVSRSSSGLFVHRRRHGLLMYSSSGTEGSYSLHLRTFGDLDCESVCRVYNAQDVHGYSRKSVSRTNVSRTNVSRTNVSRTNVSRTDIGIPDEHWYFGRVSRTYHAQYVHGFSRKWRIFPRYQNF